MTFSSEGRTGIRYSSKPSCFAAVLWSIKITPKSPRPPIFPQLLHPFPVLLPGPITKKQVGIMDRLLMYYLLWLDGHTIVQTCYSCLYLQDPQRLLKPIPALGNFVDALLVSCQHARDAINSAGVWDDEDFTPTMFNVDFQLCAFSSSA